jgi:hypothetical protein
MVRKAAEKKQSSKNTQVKASAKKGAGKKRIVRKNVKKTAVQKGTHHRKEDKNITLKAIKALVARGKKTRLFNL